MSPIIPAQPTPMLSVILKTFLAALLITNVPYEYLRSEANIAPSLQTSPTVVAPGMKPSSLINRVECGDPTPVAIKVASNGRFACPQAAESTQIVGLGTFARDEISSRGERRAYFSRW